MLKRTIEEAIPTIRMHFTQEQQDAIENGRRSYHELVNEINKVITPSKNQTFKNLYIYSRSGLGKSSTVKELLDFNRSIFYKISPSTTMFMFGVKLAKIKKQHKNQQVFIWIDDTNMLFKNEENINIMKNVLFDDNKFTYDRANKNDFGKLDPINKDAVREFLIEGEGLVIPCDSFTFIFTSNRKLPEQNELNDKNTIDQHRHALRNKMIVVDLSFSPDIIWGYITWFVLQDSKLVYPEISEEIKIKALKHMKKNWDDLRSHSLNEYVKFLRYYVEYPKDYMDHWNNNLNNN